MSESFPGHKDAQSRKPLLGSLFYPLPNAGTQKMTSKYFFLFADDKPLVAESAEKLHCSVNNFGCVCERRKLTVNVEKSKVIVVETEEFAPQMKFEVNGYALSSFWESVSMKMEIRKSI